MLPQSSPEFPVQSPPTLHIYLVWPNGYSARWSASRGKCLNDYFDSSKTAVRIKVGLRSVLGLGLVLRLWLVSGLYNWLFYLATVKQHKHVAFYSQEKAALLHEIVKFFHGGADFDCVEGSFTIINIYESEQRVLFCT